jgi:hypothetical protein
LTNKCDDHEEAKLDDVTMSLSGAIGKLTVKKKDLAKKLDNLDDREANITKLERELESTKRIKLIISMLKTMNWKITLPTYQLPKRRQWRRFMDLTRWSHADGAIDDAKAIQYYL